MLINELPPPPECGTGFSSHCGLSCIGPPGCEGDVEFHWTIASEMTRVWCGCDGVTHTSGLDWGSYPDTRWRWYGSCEEPCAEVGFNGSYWSYRPEFHDDLPIAPQCEQCRDAVRGERGCEDAEGRLMPIECCDCTRAIRDAEGACVHAEHGYEVAAFCCP